MAFVRGRYGVEYHRRTDQETHLLRRVLLAVAVLALVSFFVARSRRKPGPAILQPDPDVPALAPDDRPGAPPKAARPEPVPPRAGRAEHPAPVAADKGKSPGGRDVQPAVKSPPREKVERTTPGGKAGGSPFADKVEEWIASRTWPKWEMEMLTILRDSERQGNVQGARNAIEKLMYRPSAEDLKDQMVRRFGDLNTQLLFSGTNTQWTATVEVKRGDTLQRIASEHRTTMEALLKLNPLKDPNRLALGQKLRVLNFPDADLIVHKKLQFAELLLKKRIFKRYYVTVREDAATGAYPVANEAGSRATDRLRALIMKIAPGDRDELRLFLAPGSRITVTAQ